MFKKILDIFDKMPQDSLMVRVDKQPIVSKYYRALAITLLATIGLIIFESFIIYYKSSNWR